MTVAEIDRALEINREDLTQVDWTEYDSVLENIERLKVLRPFEVKREEREKAAKKAAHDRKMARVVSGFADAFAKEDTARKIADWLTRNR